MRIMLFVLCLMSGVAMAANTFYVDPTNGKDDGTYDGKSAVTPFKTIAYAISSSGSGDTVILADDTHYIAETIVPNANMTFRSAGGDRSQCVIDAQNQCGILLASDKGNLTISGITFQNGRSTLTGTSSGGIAYYRNASTLVISNCVVRNCSRVVCPTAACNTYGGGIFCFTGQASSKIVDTVVENCRVEVTGSTAKCAAYGGGVYNRGALLEHSIIRNCVVTNDTPCSSPQMACGGGGVFLAGAVTGYNPLVNDCVISNNVACGGTTFMTANAQSGIIGGGVFVWDGICILTNSLVCDNVAYCKGGGVGMLAGSVIGCTITNNHVRPIPSTNPGMHGGGGGIGGYNGDTTTKAVVRNCLIAENDALIGGVNSKGEPKVLYGGGLFGRLNYTISGCVFRGNRAEVGGGIFTYSMQNTVTNCIIAGNVATNNCCAFKFQNMKASTVIDTFVYGNVMTCTAGTGIFEMARTAKDADDNALVRNCAIISNAVACTGNSWGGRVAVTLTNDCTKAIVFDHCTFAGNRGGSSTAANAFLRYEVGAITDAKYCVFKGCAFADNSVVKNGVSTRVAINNSRNSADAWNISYSYFDVKATYVDFENAHNVNGASLDQATVFKDVAAQDFRPCSKTAPLVDAGGAFEDWMGTGSKRSVADLGAGLTYVSDGGSGVNVQKIDPNPRRSGNASDIGAYEWYGARGMKILFCAD